MMSKTEAKKKIERLVKKFDNLSASQLKKYNEANTRKDFILPLFHALGWDVYNDFSTNEVVEEETTISGRIDYSFRLNNLTQFLLEAKAIPEDLDKDKWAHQAIEYGWNKGISWVVLTDFEGLKLFNSDWKVDSPRPNLAFDYTEYLKRFEDLWLLSRESIEKGELNEHAKKWGITAKRVSVNEKLAEDLVKWRDILTDNLKQWNKGIAESDLEEAVQRILDRLIFIRVVEDRRIEDKVLWQQFKKWEARDNEPQNFIKLLTPIFRDFDKKYNSNLFRKHICEDLETEGDPFKKIIPQLYGEKEEGVKYRFDAINADVLGNVYEQYLGYVQGREGTKSKRKKQGIYYTPTYIVDYIVQNTLGKVLEEKSLTETENIKVLDPACGSGSFLIKAFDILNEKAKKERGSIDGIQAALRKYRILTTNIYGVDLDPQAVEIARLNLLLKALEPNKKLPMLGENIKNGNSLIEDKKVTDKPFVWNKEFSSVMDKGGFDVIVGNPPYFNVETFGANSPFTKYLNEFYEDIWQDKSDILFYFIYRSLYLLKPGGVLGFIVSRSFLEAQKAKKLRKFILKNTRIIEILDFGSYPVFEEAGIATAIIVLQKTKTRNNKIKYTRISGWSGKLNSLHNLQQDESKTEILSYPQVKLSESSWNFASKNIDKLISNIDKKSTILKKIYHVGSGMQTAANEVFTFTERGVKELGVSKKWFRKRIRNSEIKRYRLNSRNDFLLYIEDVGKFKELPEAIQKHLKHNIKKLKDRAAFKRGDIAWWRYSFPMHKELYDKPKLISPYRSNGNNFAHDRDGRFLGLTDTTVVFQKDKNYGLKYILGLLNSKLLDFRYKKMAKITGRDSFEYFPNVVGNMPIIKANKAQQKDIVELVDNVLNLYDELKKTPRHSDEWARLKKELKEAESKLDSKVYKLYDLTTKEIKIVEDNTKS